MGKQTLTEKLREWIGGIGWRVFLWSIRMTATEYIAAVVEDENRAAKSDRDSAWFTL
jgi:hypothetical protein